MTAPRLATIISSAVASALAFYVITRSGLAGTLAGAAVASILINATSHWAGQSLERGSEWYRSRRSDTLYESASAPADGEESADVEPASPATDPGVEPESSAAGPRIPRGRMVAWAPAVLAILALAFSGYALVAGEPVERVVMRDRVIEKPIVTERVIREQVIVPVPGPGQSAQQKSGASRLPPASTTTTAGRPIGTADGAATTTTLTKPANATVVTTPTTPTTTATTTPTTDSEPVPAS